MRIALSSAAFAAEFESGGTTQLEWIEACAQRGADGLTFEVRHFPRRDAEYLAQVRKFAVDLGLTPAAVAGPEAAEALELADGVGAPLAIVVPAGSLPWAEAVATIGASARDAKRRNVSLAVAHGHRSDIGVAELLRLFKEADSAWVRLAYAPAALPDALDAPRLAERLAAVVAGPAEGPVAERVVARLGAFRGFVTLERAADLPAWQRALARYALSVAEPHAPSDT